MLGEKAWEDKGKITGISIQSIGPEGVSLEANYTGEAKGFERFPDVTFVGTTSIMQKPNSISLGNDRGIMTTPDGEAVVYMGQFTGKREGGGVKEHYDLHLHDTVSTAGLGEQPNRPAR